MTEQQKAQMQAMREAEKELPPHLMKVNPIDAIDSLQRTIKMMPKNARTASRIAIYKGYIAKLKQKINVATKSHQDYWNENKGQGSQK